MIDICYINVIVDNGIILSIRSLRFVHKYNFLLQCDSNSFLITDNHSNLC